MGNTNPTFEPDEDGYDLKFPSERTRKEVNARIAASTLPSSEQLTSYRTRDGRVALAVRIGNALVGLNSAGFAQKWYAHGRLLLRRETEDDLVAAIDDLEPRTVPSDFLSTVQGCCYTDRPNQDGEFVRRKLNA